MFLKFIKKIEKKWANYWKEKKTYHVKEDLTKKKFYVLDMFQYPSGSGLHVGHPLGYIASDIYARYKRLNGFNVLHPMGYDSFGLPAEQYAIQTGQHPNIPTQNNIGKVCTKKTINSNNRMINVSEQLSSNPFVNKLMLKSIIS